LTTSRAAGCRSDGRFSSPTGQRRGQTDSTGKKAARRKKPEGAAELWELRLYVAGQAPKSLAAFANLKKICEQHLKGCYNIQVLDLLLNPVLAKRDQILAIPTLIKKQPKPVTRMIGDLSNTERLLTSLNLHQGQPESRRST
jgi:circadian clock protein KaiB